MKGIIFLLFLLSFMPLVGNDINGSTEWGSSLESGDDYILIESSLDLRFAMADDWKVSCFLEAVPPEEDELRSRKYESGASLDFPVFKGGILSLGGAYSPVESADFPSPGQERTKGDLSLEKRAVFKERIGAALFTPERNFIIHGLQDAAHGEAGFLWLPAGDLLFGKTGIIYSRERTLKKADDSWYNPEKEDIQEDLIMFMGGVGYKKDNENNFRVTGDFTYSLPRYSFPGSQYFLQGCWSGEKMEVILGASYSSLYWRSARGKLSRWRYGGGGVCDLSLGSSVSWKNEAAFFRPAADTDDELSYLNYKFESSLDSSFLAITLGWDGGGRVDNYSGEISLFFLLGHYTLTGSECCHIEAQSDDNSWKADQEIMLQICGDWEQFSIIMEGKLEYPLEDYRESGEYTFQGEVLFAPGKVWEIGWSTKCVFRPLQDDTAYYINMRISRDWE